VKFAVRGRAAAGGAYTFPAPVPRRDAKAPAKTPACEGAGKKRLLGPTIEPMACEVAEDDNYVARPRFTVHTEDP
jgi:hypothetical protein